MKDMKKAPVAGTRSDIKVGNDGKNIKKKGRICSSSDDNPASQTEMY